MVGLATVFGAGGGTSSYQEAETADVIVMVVTTRSERVDHARKMVLEFLGSSVDLSLTDHVDEWNAEYGADPSRYGDDAASVAQPVKIDNDLYVRDYAKCILCYQCVDACGEQWQNSFVIEIAGRGFDSRVSTEHDLPLPESACVYCGNCIQVCPTGALMFKSEYDMTPTRSHIERMTPRL